MVVKKNRYGYTQKQVKLARDLRFLFSLALEMCGGYQESEELRKEVRRANREIRKQI